MNDKKAMRKFCINGSMAIIYLLLMTLNTTGVLVHEILGIAFSVLVIIHITYNRKWLKLVGEGIFTNRIKVRAKLMWIMDLIMIISMLVSIITGICISKYIFSFLNISNTSTIENLHISASYICLIAISIHTGFHFSKILDAFRKVWGINEEFKTRRVILRILVIVLVLNGIRVSIQEDIGSKILSPIAWNSNKEKTIQWPEDNGMPDNNNNQYVIGRLNNNNSMARGRNSQGKGNFNNGNNGYGQQSGEGEQGYDSQYGESDNYGQNDEGNGGFYGNGQGEMPDGSSGNSQGGIPGEFNGNIKINERYTSTSGNLDSIFNIISIMSIYVAGTYYTVRLIDRKSEIKK